MTLVALEADWFPRFRRSHNTLKLPSLSRASSWGIVGAVGQSGARWGVLVVLAKLGSADVVGTFALAQAIVAPLTALTRFALRPVIATDARNEFQFQDYLSAQLVTATMCLAVLIAVALLGGFSSELAWTILFLGFASLLDATGQLNYGLLQKHEAMREIGLSILAKGSGGIVAIGVIYAWTQSLQAAVVGMGISWLIVLLTYDKANVRKLLRIEPPSAMPRSWLDLRAVWRVVLRCFPVAFSGTLKQLNVSIPRYFVQVYFGRAEVGYLAAINAFANFAIVLFRGVSQAASARLSRFHLEDRKRFVRLILKLLAISLLLSLSAIVGSLILGDWLLAVVYRFDYSEYAGVLTWMMLATLFALSATVLRTSMIAARRLIIQIPQLLLTTLVLAGACVVLVPYAGLYGAAWALLIAYFFESVSAAAIVVIHLREQTQQALSVGAESRAISRPALHEDAPSG